MYSSHDMLTLVGGIIALKGPMVLGKEARRQGKPMAAFLDSLPKSISKPMVQIRLMHARYSTGDYTHSDMEIGQCERVAQYLTDLHQEAAGHPLRVIKIVRDGPNGVNSKVPLSDGKYPPGSLYRAAIAKVREMSASS